MTSEGFKPEDWIGRTWSRQEQVTASLVEKFKATLSPYLVPDFEVPLGLHWCLVPDVMPQEMLGDDGHPRLGQILPDVGLKRRMWAGGELDFLRPLQLGDVVDKASTIENVTFKAGKSGNLCFVTLRHSYKIEGETAINERQDLVYRASNSLAVGAADGVAVVPQQDWLVQATPTLLFRYSALTFNGHRNHYDYPYATQEEGYEGLLVHGPLQATIMMNLAAKKLSRMPKRFVYRGQKPLIAGNAFGISAEAKDGSIAAVIRDHMGVVTMTAEAD